MRAVVIGCGFSGLSCALRLLEAGFRVTVLSRVEPAATVSAVAGGLWLPYRVGPVDRAAAWGAATYAELERLAREEPAAGVEVVEAVLLSERRREVEPWWVAALPAGRVREARPDELPAGRVGGRTVVAPLVQTPRYLGWLLERVCALGGTVERRAVASLEEAAAGADVVVNCAGLGARELAGDPSVRPVRGQVVLVRPLRGARVPCIVDEEGPDGLAYVLPRRDVWILGGTDDEGDWDTRVRPEVGREIVERCRRLVPALADAEVIGDRVGLRPARPEVRLEVERLAGGTPVIHDYGHGGGGLTLSWGCAGEAAALAMAVT